MRLDMSDLYWLTDQQMERLRPHFPKSPGKPRVDDRRVLSGIIFVNRNGLRWRDAPAVYGPHKTLYNRWKRWSEAGVFIRMNGGAVGSQRRTPHRDDRRDLSEGAPHGFELGGKKGGLGGSSGALPMTRSKNGAPVRSLKAVRLKVWPSSSFMAIGHPHAGNILLRPQRPETTLCGSASRGPQWPDPAHVFDQT